MSVANYSSFLFIDELPTIAAASLRKEMFLREQGLTAEAQVVALAYDRMIARLEALAARTAVTGTDILRTTERQTRVRPDTLGQGGPRLEDHLFVEPLATTLAGSVGIANLDKLDALEDDEGNTGWWLVNEQGGGRTGRIFGFFDGTKPSPSAFREHAVFRPDRSGGAGTVRKASPARRFIEKSIPIIRVDWIAEFRLIRAEWEAEIGI